MGVRPSYSMRRRERLTGCATTTTKKVSPLGENRSITFEWRMLGCAATNSSTSYVRIDDKVTHCRRALTVRDVGQHLMEVFDLLASRLVLHHAPVLTEHAKIERANHRQHDEWGLASGRNEMLLLCFVLFVSFAVTEWAGGSCLKSPNSSRWRFPSASVGSPLPRAAPPLRASSAMDRTSTIA